jgi:hypothetical protein
MYPTIARKFRRRAADLFANLNMTLALASFLTYVVADASGAFACRFFLGNLFL